jgi:hypothetical protein
MITITQSKRESWIIQIIFKYFRVLCTCHSQRPLGVIEASAHGIDKTPLAARRDKVQITNLPTAFYRCILALHFYEQILNFLSNDDWHDYMSKANWCQFWMQESVPILFRYVEMFVVIVSFFTRDQNHH